MDDPSRSAGQPQPDQPRPGQPRPGPLAEAADGPIRRAAVVVGLDGSDTSWDAFWWACGEARRMGGRAVAVYVSPSSEASMAAMVSAATGVAVCYYDDVNRAVNGEARRLQAEMEARAAECGSRVAFVHAHGDPARELLRVAGAVGADLVVVGKSTKTIHRVAGSLGRYLIAKRCGPIVVVVP